MPPGPQDLRRALAGNDAAFRLVVIVILIEIATRWGLDYYKQMLPATLDGEWPPDGSWWNDEDK